MPLFEIEVPFGPVTTAQEQTLLNIAHHIDQTGTQNSSCMFGVFDGHAIIFVVLDCYDADSARLNAAYCVRDELVDTEFKSAVNPDNYKQLKCRQIQ